MLFLKSLQCTMNYRIDKGIQGIIESLSYSSGLGAVYIWKPRNNAGDVGPWLDVLLESMVCWLSVGHSNQI